MSYKVIYAKDILKEKDKFIKQHLFTLADNGYTKLSNYISSMYEKAKEVIIADTDGMYQGITGDCRTLSKLMDEIATGCSKDNIELLDIENLIILLLRMILRVSRKPLGLIASTNLKQAVIKDAELKKEDLDKLRKNESKLHDTLKSIRPTTDDKIIEFIITQYNTSFAISLALTPEKQSYEEAMSVPLDFSGILETLIKTQSMDKDAEKDFGQIWGYHQKSLIELTKKEI